MKYIEVLSSDVISLENIKVYQSHVKEIKKKIGIFFAGITDQNFNTLVEKLCSFYVSDFWSIMCKNKRITEISKERFEEYLENNPSDILSVLEHKEIAIKYSDIIYTQLLKHPRVIYSIISYFLASQTQAPPTIYIIEAFSTERIRALFLAYIESNSPHINMLSVINESNNDPSIGLDDEIRLLAKRKEIELAKTLFKNTPSIYYGVEVTIKNSNTLKEYELNDNFCSITYDKKAIHQDLDYPSLLNHFIFTFDYVDKQFRSEFPIQHDDYASITDFLRINGKKSYNTSATYDMKCKTFSLQMIGFIKELESENIELEKLFKWFFEEYLEQEFAAKGFFYNASSAGTSYLEKCRNIATEIDAVLKQYKLFCKYGSIDKELFVMSSEHLFFSDIPSMNDRKYIYAKSERLKSCIQHLFCSNLMTYTNNGKYKDYDNLAQVLVDNNDVQKDEFDSIFQQKHIEDLLHLDILYEKDGLLRLNKEKAIILRHLHDKNVLCYNWCKNVHHIINELIESGDLSQEFTLFSKPEQDYLDFILNKASFSDGLNLRNKYLHGTTIPDEQVNYQDYIEFLKIMVLIIIKINEEFCLKYPEKSD